MGDLHDCFAHLRLSAGLPQPRRLAAAAGAHVTSWIFKTRVIRAREVEPHLPYLPARTDGEKPCLPSDLFLHHYTGAGLCVCATGPHKADLLKNTKPESFSSLISLYPNSVQTDNLGRRSLLSVWHRLRIIYSCCFPLRRDKEECWIFLFHAAIMKTGPIFFLLQRKRRLSSVNHRVFPFPSPSLTLSTVFFSFLETRSFFCIHLSFRFRSRPILWWCTPLFATQYDLQFLKVVVSSWNQFLWSIALRGGVPENDYPSREVGKVYLFIYVFLAHFLGRHSGQRTNFDPVRSGLIAGSGRSWWSAIQNKLWWDCSRCCIE